MANFVVKITVKRQVTLPAHVLESLGVKPGDRLKLEEEPDGFVLRARRIDRALLAPLRGKLRRGIGTFDLEAFRRQIGTLWPDQNRGLPSRLPARTGRPHARNLSSSSDETVIRGVDFPAGSCAEGCMRKDQRRGFLLASSALLALPLMSIAQPAQKTRRIGFLSLDTSDSPAGQSVLKAFPAALNKLGYKVGENLVIEWRWAEGKVEDLSGLAEDLVRGKVEIIVARTNGPIHAAKRATKTIPIVMFNGNLPVEDKLVESLARPGGNVTGTSYIVPSMYAKQMQILKELAPRATRIAVVVNSSSRGSSFERVMQASMQGAASALGVATQTFYVTRPDDVPAVLNEVVKSGCNAFWYGGDPVLRARNAEIVAFLRDNKLASIGTIPGFAESGGLAHYAPDFSAFVDRTASYVDRILNGARPADMPVEEPTKYELVVNVKTAKAIGLAVSQSILARADRIIE